MLSLILSAVNALLCGNDASWFWCNVASIL